MSEDEMPAIHLSSPLGSSLTFHKELFYCICYITLLRWIGGWPQHYSDVASSCWSQLEALDSRVYQSELHIVEGRAIVELLENLRELAQATAPFLCETQVGTLRCHCWLTNMIVGTQIAETADAKLESNSVGSGVFSGDMIIELVWMTARLGYD